MRFLTMAQWFEFYGSFAPCLIAVFRIGKWRLGGLKKSGSDAAFCGGNLTGKILFERCARIAQRFFMMTMGQCQAQAGKENWHAATIRQEF